jgi:hypothetical protein
VRGESDHRNRGGPGGRFDTSSGLPAIDQGEAHVHQDQVGLLGLGHRDALLTVHRNGGLEAFAGEAPREHIAIHLVVFDYQNFRHVVTGNRLAAIESPRFFREENTR